MSFFRDLFGRTSANSARQLGQRNEGRINEGYSNADRVSAEGYGRATGRIQNFANTGGAAYDLYSSSYGANGEDARNRAFQTYSSDPFNQHSNQQTQNMLTGMFRKYHAQGMGNSGNSQMAIGRAGLEAQDRRIADWRSGLSGLASQGYQASNALAGLDNQYYGGMADRAVGRVGALNQNDVNATQAENNARMSGVNNLLSIGGNVARMGIGGFAPGASGTSAFGNIANAFAGRGWV